jgi:tricorn protease
MTMMNILSRSLRLAMAAALILPTVSHAQTKLLRFPDIHGEQVVFSYGGDLWLAPASGGSATRLTAHPGKELFAKFSPDGRWIAFTGQYDGDEQVYVMPATGGVPKQLTFYPARGPLAPRWGYDNQVYGWTPDGSAVLFRTLRDSWTLGDPRLYTVSYEGGLPKALPMRVAGAGALSPDGGRIVFSPLFRDFRTWKRYQGGWAQDLWIFDLASSESQQITDHVRADRDPMWVGDRIYFTSDRDGTLNLFSYDPATSQTSQLTRSATWDVRWPSDDGASRIVYELDGELNIFDVAAATSTRISISVPDDGVAMRPSRISVAGNIEGWGLSPKGERALFVARGDVFTAPIERGPTRNLTKSSNAHDKHARWSPDGSKIAFISDMSGEEEVYWINQDGSGAPVQLTTNGAATGMRYAPEWSPDGKFLVSSDKEGRIWLIEVESQRMTEVTNDPQGQVTDYTWSPKGGFLAFTLSDPSGVTSIYVYSVAERQLHRVTGSYFNEFSPTWGAAGDFLYYVADRAFAPQIGSFEFNYAVDRESGIYALALRPDVKHPFPPRSDEVSVGEDEEQEDEEKAEGYITIAFDGLAERVVRVPVEYDNYFGVTAVEGHLVYVRGTPFYYGRSPDIDTDLKIYSLEDRKESTLAEDINGGAISHDGKKALIRHGSSFKLYDVKPNGGNGKAVSTAGLMVDRIPAQEWEQIFHEVWRRFRDWFYVENMHGYDWEALRAQYVQQLEHVAHRSDLNYVLGEMVAELSVSHAYIQGGDWETPDRARVALLGARFELDEGSGRYRIAQIYRGQNDEERYRVPLTELGVNVGVGDYILAINGQDLIAPENPYRLLRNKAGHPVTLTVNDRPTTNGAREVTVNPRTSENSLHYFTWVAEKRDYVTQQTGGRVGYLHLPDMGSNGIREFIKWYYGQVRKEGLIVDVRANGGGNVSQMVIDRLRRELLGLSFNRTFEWPDTYPGSVFTGHMVALINEHSASDGDIFPWMFRKAGLGPLIGKRTWGGVIGISGHGPLIDGGNVFVPQYGSNDVDGAWVMENRGVEPDIEVANTPTSLVQGRDLQLERGIAEIMQKIEAEPVGFPQRPAPPVKTKP